jgi:hypothetical protein
MVMPEQLSGAIRHPFVIRQYRPERCQYRPAESPDEDDAASIDRALEISWYLCTSDSVFLRPHPARPVLLTDGQPIPGPGPALRHGSGVSCASKVQSPLTRQQKSGCATGLNQSAQSLAGLKLFVA